jgi:hypothetical protein
MRKSTLFTIGGLVLGLGIINTSFAAGVVNENSQAYVSCRNSVGNAYQKFLHQGKCKQVMHCISNKLKQYGDTRNILIDAMVKCGKYTCRQAIGRYDYSTHLLKCVQNYNKK